MQHAYVRSYLLPAQMRSEMEAKANRAEADARARVAEAEAAAAEWQAKAEAEVRASEARASEVEAKAEVWRDSTRAQPTPLTAPTHVPDGRLNDAACRSQAAFAELREAVVTTLADASASHSEYRDRAEGRLRDIEAAFRAESEEFAAREARCGSRSRRDCAERSLTRRPRVSGS